MDLVRRTFGEFAGIKKNLFRIWNELRREGTFTLLLVPHSARRVFRLSLQRWLMWAVLGGVLGTVLLLLGVFISYGLLMERLSQDAALRQVNAREAAQMARLYGQTSAINQEMAQIQAVDQEVQQLVGERTAQVPGNPVSFRMRNAVSSRGGVERGERMAVATAVQIQTLRQQLPVEEAKVARLQAAVREEDGFLRAVPQGWPAYGRISSGWGWRINPIFGTPEFHKGVDIALFYGTPLRATGSGQVSYVGWESGYGQLVKVDDGYGYTYLYSHLSGSAVHEGERVHRGQVVAYVGSTGWSTGPHVYYQVFLYGRPLNPIPFLGLAVRLGS